MLKIEETKPQMERAKIKNHKSIDYNMKGDENGGNKKRQSLNGIQRGYRT